uniref:RNA editing comple protein MP63 n=1 Tax=Trypanosoma vivax (strain Y486) TaxID=1055687 RepID=G0U7A5_TRYVY
MYRLLSRGVTVKCSCWLVTARCPVRGLRVHRSLSSTHTRCDLSSVLCCQTRAQSTTDKKFHCSICKKAFRLEMAAKLHLQQAHGGDGTVEAGAGPGVESLPAAPNGDVAAPPSNPIEKRFSEDEERRPRRMRPTPKPLHEPDRGVPDEIMGELLGMWDTVGLRPHAQCVSNITIVGRVLDVTTAGEDISHVTVFVEGEQSGEEETVMLCCFGDVSTLVRNTLKRNAVVFVNGTLRLHPVYEASNNKYYVSPVVHVALPTGTLCVIT